MKTIILCGGQGMRMKEETEFKPKPLVSVGGKPILSHIMKIYAHHGYNEFVLPLGYKGNMIRDYFSKPKNLSASSSVIFADTGINTLIADRILRVRKYITEDEFMLTYGDGVADVDIKELVRFHRRQGTIGTITGVHPYSKYGLVAINPKSKLVTAFDQKPRLKDYVSGGFMIFNKKAFDYFRPGEMEDAALARMAEDGQLSMFEHNGFWKAMDTHREREELNELWHASKPWAVWLAKK